MEQMFEGQKRAEARQLEQYQQQQRQIQEQQQSFMQKVEERLAAIRSRSTSPARRTTESSFVPEGAEMPRAASIHRETAC